MLIKLFPIYFLSTISGQIRIGLLSRQRVCPQHTPLAVNSTVDLEICRREVAAAKLRLEPVKQTAQIIREHGYDLETNRVTSYDGYITTIYRIPGGRRSPRKKGKAAVILFHGIGGVSDVWFVLPTNKNLAFKLADAGYDVWMPNVRGTDKSRDHVTLNSNQIAYWDFSFHEMGIYDLPAIINLVLEITQNSKLFYIAHSQGGALYLIGLSEIPELNDKVHAAFLLAPSAYIGGSYLTIVNMWLPILYTPLETLVYHAFIGRVEMRTPRTFLTYLGLEPIDICSVRVLQCDICDNAFYNLFDSNPSQANYTNSPNLLRQLGTMNFKALIHFGQNILSCQFRKYDYGVARNLIQYGSSQPPQYNLRNVRAPLHIYHAEQDQFITPPDVERLVAEINHEAIREVHMVTDLTFDHADFVAGKDADILVYDRVIEAMTSYLDTD